MQSYVVHIFQVDPTQLFFCPTEKKEATAKLKMPAFLSSEAKGADYLVLWLDCDKEGENICFEVIDCVTPSMKKPQGRQQQIYRYLRRIYLETLPIGSIVR